MMSHQVGLARLPKYQGGRRGEAAAWGHRPSSTFLFFPSTSLLLLLLLLYLSSFRFRISDTPPRFLLLLRVLLLSISPALSSASR